MKIGVVTFPGSLDDRDAHRAIRLAGGESVALWHAEHDLRGVDALVLPGGFSYGDYLRAGALASLSPIMAEIIDAARRGVPILGVCNGFQMLTEAHLLPGALIRNRGGTFLRRDQCVRIDNATTSWTSQFVDGEEIILPLKSGEGCFTASAEDVKRLEGEGEVVCRYFAGKLIAGKLVGSIPTGQAGQSGVNPNGSVNNIAGITNSRGTVVGLMPHPEHAVERGFGPDTPDAMRAGVDGLTFFTSVLSALAAA
jgi:phosphoribosylformylglycinamidine synthase subunit PurQ / glutaminase